MISVDLSKKIIKPKLQLCKNDLNKTAIGNLTEAYGINQNTSLGNINELSFLLPYEIDNNHELIRNKNVDKVKERYLIKCTKNSFVEYYIITKISDVMEDDKDYKKIECYSLGYELSNKLVLNYKVESYTLPQMLTGLLGETIWTTDYIDSEFNLVYRALEISSATVLDAIQQVAELFNALIIYNTTNRKISFYKLENIGQNIGTRIQYGKLMKNVTLEKSTTDYCNRLKVFGQNGISIEDVTSTGTNYIENYSSILYPFERDVEGNVLSHSDHIGDSLAHALLDYQELVDSKQGEITSLISQITTLNTTLASQKSVLVDLETDLDNIEENLAAANSTGGDPSSYITQKNNKVAEISNQETAIATTEASIDSKNDEIDAVKALLSLESNFTTEQITEWNPHIIVREWVNENYSKSDELLEAAKEEFLKMQEPKIVVNISIVNLFEVITEQKNWSKLNLGDIITIYHEKLGINIQAKILEISFDYESSDVNLTIGNVREILSDEERFYKNLYKSISSSANYNKDKFKINDSYLTSSEIYQTINSTWDATSRDIKASYNNTVEISNRGIRVTDPSDPLKMLIIQNGLLAISSDGGNHWKTAIKHDKIVAENILGVLGEFVQLRANQIIVGDSGQKIEDGIITSATTWNTAAANATSANALLADLSSDNKLTALEKQETKKQWDIIVGEKTIIDLEATTYGITTEKTNYGTSYNTLNTYLTPLLANLATTSDIVGTTFRTNFKDYFDKKTTLLKVISEKAKTLADTAQTSADTANGLLSDIASDSKLTPLEKQQIKLEWDVIVSEKPNLEAQATTYGITTEKTTYTNAYNSLNTYITPLLSNLATTSDIVGTTFRTNFKTYFDARTALLKAISEKAKVLADNAQTTANNAWNKFSGVGDTLPSGNVEFNFATSSTKGGNATNTDNVGTQSASNVQGATVNFNSRNDRKSTAPANPTILTDGTAIDHTLNDDSSVDVSFEWTFTGSGDAYDVDGFIVYINQSSSSSAYTFGTTVASEQVFYVTPEKRSFILYGVTANRYYTFGIQAYRIVDQDINSSGVLKSTIVKSTATGENPYQPSSTIAYAGNITGTVDGVSASAVAYNSTNNNINLLQNGGAEIYTGKSGTNIPDGWGTYIGSSPSSLVSFGRRINDSSWTISGNASFEITTGVPQAGAPSNSFVQDVYGIVAGQTYTVSALLGAHRCTVALELFFFDASNNVLGNPAVTHNTSTPTKKTITQVLPANTTRVRVEIRKHDTNAGQTNSYLFADNVKLEKGNQATPYVEVDLGSSGTINNGVQQGSSYKSVIINSDGLKVSDGAGTAVQMGEYATGKYGVIAYHSDGSTTELNGSGLVRVKAGTTKPYSYLVNVGSGQTGSTGMYFDSGGSRDSSGSSTNIGTVWIQLPSDFNGKTFNVALSAKGGDPLAMASADGESFYLPLFVAKSQLIVKTFDYPNGRFEVEGWAYYFHQGSDFNLYQKYYAIEFSYMAVV